MYIYNTATNRKELFEPLSDIVKMYVCGPTVYDYIHIGNARPLVCFDVLYRILKFKYKNVLYVRNITDVDDKIINRASLSNMHPMQVSEIFSAAFEMDAKELCCISPTHEPKATAYIDHMIKMIERLIENGHAYVVNDNVYFDVMTYGEYGKFSKRDLVNLDVGSRVAVSDNKKSPFDFVLWKPAKDSDGCFWSSPWGNGRPGWHIECSAMSTSILGNDFDIHCGGVDLVFPHHENEIAQSRCCYAESNYAKYWMHNGFITFDGDKMSKSIGNILTIRSLLEKNIKGEVIRYALLSTHYRKIINWNDDLIGDSNNILNKMYSALSGMVVLKKIMPDENFLDYLYDDINTPGAISILHNILSKINKENNLQNKNYLQNVLYQSGMLIGIFNKSYDNWFCISNNAVIEDLIEKRNDAKKVKNYFLADSIRKQLSDMDVQLFDNHDGTTAWKKIDNY